MQSLLETDGLEDQCRISQSPLSHVRSKKGSAGVRPMLTPRHSERALLSDSTSSSERNNSVGRLSGIVRWFRRSSKERCSVDLESGIGPDLAASLMRQGSLKIQGGRRAGDGLGRSLQRARRRVERRLGRMGIGKGKKKVSGTEEVLGSCKFIILFLVQRSLYCNIIMFRPQSSKFFRFRRRTQGIRSCGAQGTSSCSTETGSRWNASVFVPP